MATQRKFVFSNDNYYHVFNRGIDRRDTFLSKWDYKRAINLLAFYQYATVPVRYSRYQSFPLDVQQQYLTSMKTSGRIVNVIAYCLMPNHFHLLLKQKTEKGVANYMSNFVNAYTKYFNTKHERGGSLFQGVFKAVYVETDEQLLHLTRYIHLNPVSSSLIVPEEIDTYPWSSYPAYRGSVVNDIVARDTISEMRALVPDYEGFVTNQVSYAKELEKIKHLVFL